VTIDAETLSQAVVALSVLGSFVGAVRVFREIWFALAAPSSCSAEFGVRGLEIQGERPTKDQGPPCAGEANQGRGGFGANQGKYDFAHPNPPHAAFRGGSTCGANGECECPQWPTSYGGIVKCMWAEDRRQLAPLTTTVAHYTLLGHDQQKQRVLRHLLLGREVYDGAGLLVIDL
jgi:hypothetical protein